MAVLLLQQVLNGHRLSEQRSIVLAAGITGEKKSLSRE